MKITQVNVHEGKEVKIYEKLKGLGAESGVYCEIFYDRNDIQVFGCGETSFSEIVDSLDAISNKSTLDKKDYKVAVKYLVKLFNLPTSTTGGTLYLVSYIKELDTIFTLNIDNSDSMRFVAVWSQYV